jgi:ATP-dependent Zn protease
MARNHHHGTGAEIKDIVNEAVLLTFAGDREGGGIDKKDLTNAMLYKRYGESTGINELASNAWGTAVHEAGHALAFHYLLHERANIWFASIEGRGATGGMVVPSPTDDDWKMSSTEMKADMQVSLASRVAEMLVCGEPSNGHGGDGPAATMQAFKYVKMGHHRTVSFLVDKDPEFMVELVEEVLTAALDDVTELLREKDVHLRLVAKLLERDHTVPGDKIHKMLDWLDERYDV